MEKREKKTLSFKGYTFEMKIVYLASHNWRMRLIYLFSIPLDTSFSYHAWLVALRYLKHNASLGMSAKFLNAYLYESAFDRKPQKQIYPIRILSSIWKRVQ